MTRFAPGPILLVLLAGGVTVAAERRGAPAAPPALTAVRALESTTPLATGKRAPALLVPDDPAWAGVAAQLTQGLARQGIPVERVQDIAAADPARRTVLCVGSMVNNPLVERLYWNRYTFVDALTPGTGQFLLHTVFDPYPYNGGHNIVILGCHDVAGAEAGVARFLSLLQDGRLPYVVEAGPRPALSAAEIRRIAARPPEPTFLDFLQHANRYLQSGAEAHARQAIATLERMVALYAPGGQRAAGTTLTYQRLPFDEEMASWEILCAWDAFEECPLITTAQRLAFANVMLRFTRELVRYCSEYKMIDANYRLSWNHTTFPLLGLHFGARYFDRYHRLADMPEMLTKAKWCFGAQARAWKPQEDADLYMTLTTEHAYVYCMAEDRMDPAVIASLRRTADYVVGWCDNLGRSSGFGDATIISTPRFLGDRLVPLALWWTGDGSYRWLMDHYSGGTWKNPYERGVAPVRPDRFTGLNVFRMDPAVYDFTQSRPSYSEPLQRAEVPLAEAFDKITFRENWEPGGQYLILDGLARGKHLHYDGNSILGFEEGGERWLLAHDYLTRNTTEHTMLSVLRRGRCDQLVPSLAGLAASADLAGLGYTRTYVKAYNGCDWERQILWRKGGWFLVADTVTPRAGDQYTFDLSWKTIDSGGHQHVDARGAFLATRGLGEERTHDCTVLDEPKAAGGKVLQVNSNGSRLVFGVDLPAGDYTLSVAGAGKKAEQENDRLGALQVAVDGGPARLIGLSPLGGPAQPEGSPDVPALPVTLTGESPHVVQITPVGHRAPLRLDQVVWRDAHGRTHAFEAEALPAPPPARADRSRRFWIKSVDPVVSWVTHHERPGIPLPVSLLHQRQEGEYRAGQKVAFASLLYTSRPGAPRELQPVRLGENLLAVAGNDPGLVLLGAVDCRGVRAEVEAGLVSAQSIALGGLRSFRVGELAVTCTAPTALEWDLASGRVEVRAPASGAELRFTIADRTQTQRLSAGRHEVRLEPLPAPLEARKILSELMRPPAPTPPAPRETSRPAVSPPRWSAFEPAEPIAAVKLADLADGAGERVLVCRGNSLHCLSLDGHLRWTFTTKGRVRDVAWGELRPSPGREILVGSADTHVYLLSASGQLLERQQMRGVMYARAHGDNPYGVYNVGIWDLDDDGQNEIVVTLSSYDVQVRTADWRLRWNQHHALHGSRQLSFEDLDGDGRAETVLVGDRYGNCVGLSPAGQQVYRGTTSIGDVAYVVTSFDGGASRQIVTGSMTGDLMATPAHSASKPLWRFDNFGYAVNRLRSADLDGDGRSEIIVASGTGTLFVLNAAGKVRWQDRVGYGINDVLVIEGTTGARVVYCDESGPVRVADGSGRVLHEFHPPAAARLLTFAPGAQSARLLLALADGRVVAYDMGDLSGPGAPPSAPGSAR